MASTSTDDPEFERDRDTGLADPFNVNERLAPRYRRQDLVTMPTSYPTLPVVPFNSEDGKPVVIDLQPNTRIAIGYEISEEDGRYTKKCMVIGRGTHYQDDPFRLFPTTAYQNFTASRDSRLGAFQRVSDRLRDEMINLHDNDAPTIDTTIPVIVDPDGGVSGELSIATFRAGSEESQRITTVFRTITIEESLHGKSGAETETLVWGCQEYCDGNGSDSAAHTTERSTPATSEEVK